MLQTFYKICLIFMIAQQPAHEIELEQAHKAPVDAADDHEDETDFIKGLHKKTLLPLGSMPDGKEGYAFYRVSAARKPLPLGEPFTFLLRKPLP